MKDLRFFETEADYKNASIEYPNVSYTKDSEDVWIIDNPNKIIMTSESNPAAMEVCYLQGWAANENYMTKAEAEAVTDIGTAFKNAGNDYGVTMKELYSFNEFKYFTNITSISDGAFTSCSSLSSITIPNSVTSIGANAFYYCDSLSSIICLAETAPTILSNTFRYICSNGVLKVPSGSDYSSWMSTSSYYLGYYNWTKEEI